ncbi:2-phosphosulfolactate phosphatase [Orenia metallireducens]|jgi:2-phosphosulfolactate phosphatase|uniref:Probable 2-phosphosulfolactate phosphatase n=1 Tax=Orenia metallireducens TaxID=1413210 RepID=A0A1C0AAN3_9FIRM|nr:2-phosphosulfolactate phosphatase [Orenia metallireducens]OCL27347.1 2-phosphosulfolactate phosphatase [Orenia metallireducens]
MEVDVIFSADRIEEDNVRNKTAVVIDTLRATSTIVTSLANGAKDIIPVVSIEEAKRLKRGLAKKALVAGERGGIKIEEFDLGNSPRAYSQEVVLNKNIILTTTNGTKCFARLESAQEVVVLSLLNLEAINNYLQDKEKVVFCCAGTHGEFALDDFITAGKAITKLSASKEVKLSDRALVAYQIYLQNKDNLLNLIKGSKSGQNLISLGKEEDIDYIVEGREFGVVPSYCEGKIRI